MPGDLRLVDVLALDQQQCIINPETLLTPAEGCLAELFGNLGADDNRGHSHLATRHSIKTVVSEEKVVEVASLWKGNDAPRECTARSGVEGNRRRAFLARH